ncbi:DUF2075 domain-containing protein [Loigolactobacillus bifermentans]|uniref:Schlafen group 3-like DNA/RNA helicase domain-containing protein n=1 Tax=Loigolactobacillus bifermentans DSM 20003 TaxID=1423726 RepID=A0A0R1H8C2_9LACO|nr:DUF2075 domain-containing protein [Loigolactobacillus bifermentans]KRK40145.1 hypothetical protein FC07_GL001346 [Loigolactobacillus bifermentans DSM 20003]QGG60891.1 DUF2075 domain-containing protein [Loigolactobacillus bifermentans]
MVRAHNQATAKLAPDQALSTAQTALVQHILTFCQQHWRQPQTAVFVIHGAAGTGKSVVLSHLLAVLQQARQQPDSPFYQGDNHLLINHPEMVKTYKQIAGQRAGLRKKDVEKPTPFINRYAKLQQRADVVLVDEAHLLLTQSDRYNRFDQTNQLTEILKESHIIILVFDATQMLKFKSYWPQQLLTQVLAPYPTETTRLTQQFRVQAGPAIQHWLTAFGTAGQLLPQPQPDSTFDLRIYTDANQLYAHLRQQNQRYGLSRLVATADFPYTLDGKTYYVETENFKQPWDKNMDPNVAWAERPKTIDEVGSIYTVQGFDLNYVGVILGPSVGYDAQHDCLAIRPERYEDQEAFKQRRDVTDPAVMAEMQRQIILNSINVLITRGRQGLYLYASDPVLRRRLAQL